MLDLHTGAMVLDKEDRAQEWGGYVGYDLIRSVWQQQVMGHEMQNLRQVLGGAFWQECILPGMDKINFLVTGTSRHGMVGIKLFQELFITTSFPGAYRGFLYTKY